MFFSGRRQIWVNFGINKTDKLLSLSVSVFRRLAFWLVSWVVGGWWIKSRAAADGPESPSALWSDVKLEQTVRVVLVSGARRNQNGPERSIRDRTERATVMELKVIRLLLLLLSLTRRCSAIETGKTGPETDRGGRKTIIIIIIIY